MQANPAAAVSLLQSIRPLVLSETRGDELERMVASLKRSDLSSEPSLEPLRVKVLGNITTDYLVDHLRLMLVRAGIGGVIEAGKYGGLVRGLLGEADLSASACDAALVVLTHRDLQYPPAVGISVEHAREQVAREVGFWISAFERIRCPAVVLSFDTPPYRILDELDGLVPGGLGWHARMTNLQIAAQLPAHVALVDAEALQYRVGAAHWFDERLYNLCKQPFAMEVLPEIADTLVAALIGLRGRSKKVLVLDLDNTLWGGVVGDDGLQGIILGPETADGEAFAAFQDYVRKLSQRGIILAVCSKNRDEVARSPFRDHSAMVLREDDIACFVANFEDKATNLRRIARTLNVGLDSLVFVDDNPVERALVRAELPEVCVVELPEDPAYFARALEASKCFPLRALTREDLGRGSSYRAMAAVREAATAPGTDMEGFLAGLEPVAEIEHADASTVDRIVQLIGKTNQFKLNLTTFHEGDILSANNHVLALRLRDRLQDYGIVSVAVVRAEGSALDIANWVMSCRVFGRRLEDVMLDILRSSARLLGCTSIRARYQPTGKNVILPGVLDRLGFAAADSLGVRQRPIDAPLAEAHHMKIVDKRKNHG